MSETTISKEQAAEATARILEYAWQAKKRELAESTIKQHVYRLKQRLNGPW